MKRLRASLPLILCGPLLVLTYFLVQGTIPAPARHEATLAALRGLVLNNAALQRDVLRAHAGLLRSYDPLVESVADLRRSAAALVPAVEIATGEAQSELRRRIEAIGIAIAAQEDLLERFKSQNALLGNSVSYFNHLIAAPGDGALAPGRLLRSPASLAGCLVRWVRQEYEFRRSTAALREIDDRLLADIGLTRVVVDHGARRGETVIEPDRAVRR